MESLEKVNLLELIHSENDKINHFQTTKEWEENAVSELHMHKMLYILFGLFYKKFAKDLFEKPNFEAWESGPVEIDFRTALKTQTLKQIDKFNIYLRHSELEFLTKLINKFLHFSPWTLVDIVHTSDAWANNYKPDGRNKISVEDIRESFGLINNE